MFRRVFWLFVLCGALCFSPFYEAEAAQNVPIPPSKPVRHTHTQEAIPPKAVATLIVVPSKPKDRSFIQKIIPTLKKTKRAPSIRRTHGQSFNKTIILYRKIFALQNRGQFQEADKLIERLKNTSLMGHILLHRYTHPAGYNASFAELVNWLRNYADHPSAQRIYKMAQKRQPPDHTIRLPKPYHATYMNGSLEAYDSPKVFSPVSYQRTQEQDKDVQALAHSVDAHIKKGFPTGALNALHSFTGRDEMSQYERDILITKIALSFLIEGKPNDAFNHASVVADRYGKEIPLSGWVSGISAWTQKRYALSAVYFEKTALSPYINAQTISASAYWAARSYTKIKNKDKADYWLRESALYARTFYGILASKKLGVTEEFNWDVPDFTPEMRHALFSHRRGERAYFLAAIGLENMAVLELEAIDLEHNSMLQQAVYAFAKSYNLSRFLYKFGNSFKRMDGSFYDVALYPELSSWAPMPSHKIDKALIHAIIRQESRFKTDAHSPNGALGLMQILPSTAAYVTKNPALKTTKKRTLLHQETNIKIGEAYIASLLSQPSIDHNLFSFLIAYNAGPGNLKKWKKKIKVRDDPLLFIELIPSSETRAFIERVMSNLWIYREAFGQEAPSLEAIIHDHWPPYRALDHL